MKSTLIYLSLLVCFFVDAPVRAQFRPTLDNRFREDYYYKLNQQQASDLFNYPDKPVDSNIFAGQYYTSDNLPLPQGNYVKVNFESNKMLYGYTPVTNWRIYFTGDDQKAAVQLLDLKTNKPVIATSVFYNKRKLSYDEKTGTYGMKKHAIYGVVTVVDNGEKFYFNTDKHGYNRPTPLQQRVNKYLYKDPVRYGTVLYQFYNRFTMDAIRFLDFRRHYTNSYAYVRQTGQEIWNRITYDRDNDDHESVLKSYFYFSKPKYKPADTIKFKVHLLQDLKKGTWYNKPVWVFLDEDDRNICLGKAYSKRPGAGYDFSFVILDSMDIDLDDDYEITLRDMDSNSLASAKFTYEAYELQKSVFTIDLPGGTDQYKGKLFQVRFSAKDENGLPMPDTRATVTLYANSVSYVKPDALFIPDTLWQYSFAVKNGDDKIMIPDSVFPAATLNYNLYVSMQNSENERTDLRRQITYHLSDRSLKLTLNKDSIYITGPEGDTGSVHVYAEDRFEFRLVDTLVPLPCTLPLNTHARAYYVENEETDTQLRISEQSAGVSAGASRSKDSVFLSIYNPRGLAVVYHLYESGKELRKGTQYDFPFAAPAKDKSAYKLLIEYVWAGATRGEYTYIPSNKNNITLDIEQPAVVTPGKETDIIITATDYKGRPVQNLNLLSYSFTQKFGEYDIPDLPYHNYIGQFDKGGEGFSLHDYNQFDNVLLDYPFWNARLIMDTNWTYRFRYPVPDKPEYTYIALADSITQFAPFVMDHGAPQAIQYVFIDYVPVYLGFTDKRAPYSFATDTNYHNVQIRTSKKLIIIDSLKVKPFVKTLFSIDQNNPGAVKTLDMPDSFTNVERGSFSMYVMKIAMRDEKLKYAYMQGKGEVNQYFDLSKTDNVYRGNMAESTIGPVCWRYWDFEACNDFSRSFEYEPGYAYTFDANVVKMKSVAFADMIPRYLSTRIPDIDAVVLTRKSLLKAFEARDFEERRRSMPNMIESALNRGSCNLTIEYDKKKTGFFPINILLCKPGDFNFLNVYAGQTTRFYNLKPGKYQVVLVQQYNAYLQSGIIDVKENGTNFYRIVVTDTLQGLNETLINKVLQGLYLPQHLNKHADVGILMNELLKGNKVFKAGVYSGVILDGEQNNEPLIGASIKLTGTNIGTQTDLDGNFEIVVPEDVGNGTLEVSYAGYATQTVRAEPNMRVVLKTDGNALSEVVITTPYGPPVSKGSYVGAADVVTSRKISQTSLQDIATAIEGAAPGLQITNGSGEPGTGASIQIRGRSSVSSANMPLIILNGAPFDGDITLLDPSLIASVNILKDAMATSLYGSRGANGVILITLKRDAELPEQIRKGLQEMPVPEDLMVSGLRNHFRDDAYWQPDLLTDARGKTSFKVKFPDDITNWKTVVVATDDKKHASIITGNIKSFKPVSASLYLPHFLLDGDSAWLIGKAVNYIPDTIPATTAFYQNDTLIQEHAIRLGAFANDTLLVTGKGTDSIKLKYVLTKEDGYFDGEEKTIPLQRVGVKVAEGSFITLDKPDTSFLLYPTAKGDTLHLQANASLTDVLLDEIDVLRDYGYMCNEQKASKVLAFLAKEKIYAALQQPFEEEDKQYVQDLINKIVQSRNSNNRWGWWEQGATIPWISCHVLKALTQAKAMGYHCNIDLAAVTAAYVFQMERDTVYTDLPTLQLLAACGTPLNYEKYISRIEHSKDLSLNTAFELILLRQQMHLPYKLDRLTALKESDLFGNIYWKDTASYVYNNEVLTTLNALKILQKDSSTGIPVQKIINWLLQQRSVSGWRNTYESANIIEALAGSIPLGNKAALKPVLQFSGGMDEAVTVFPYKKDIVLGNALQVKKSGYTPVYFSWYYNKWDTSNANGCNNFRVSSRFETSRQTVSVLPAGVPVNMKVRIDVEKSAEFVMITIPVPAGCSYQSKGQFYANHEIHREYFEDRVCIFCEKLPKGAYEYNVELLPRYQGSYTLNPAKAELMYFPVFYGREKIKRVAIEE